MGMSMERVMAMVMRIDGKRYYSLTIVKTAGPIEIGQVVFVQSRRDPGLLDSNNSTK